MIRLLILLCLPLAAFAQTRDDFRAALLAHEGYSLTAYRDSLGYLTIGIGHKLLPGESRHWTPAQVEAAFSADLFQAINKTHAQVPSYLKHPNSIRVLLVELTYQCGSLRGFTRFRRAIDTRDYLTAAQELKRSKLARQTPKRVDDYIRVLTRAAR